MDIINSLGILRLLYLSIYEQENTMQSDPFPAVEYLTNK